MTKQPKNKNPYFVSVYMTDTEVVNLCATLMDYQQQGDNVMNQVNDLLHE